jgi:hypothetical protein
MLPRALSVSDDVLLQTQQTAPSRQLSNFDSHDRNLPRVAQPTAIYLAAGRNTDLASALAVAMRKTQRHECSTHRSPQPVLPARTYLWYIKVKKSHRKKKVTEEQAADVGILKAARP